MLIPRLYDYYQAVDDSKTGKATSEDVLDFFSYNMVEYVHQGYGGTKTMTSRLEVLDFLKQEIFCGVGQHNVTNVRVLGNVTMNKGVEYATIRVEGVPRSVQIVFSTRIEWHKVDDGSVDEEDGKEYETLMWKIQRMHTTTTRIYLDSPGTVIL